MKKAVLYLLLVCLPILQGCGTLKYERLDLIYSNPKTVLKHKLNKKSNHYSVTIHSINHTDSLAPVIQLEKGRLEDKQLKGKVGNIENFDIQQKYYHRLRAKRMDDIAYTGIEQNEKTLRLDQLHIWVNDSIYQSISTEVNIKTSQILAIEKVRTFKPRWVLFGLLYSVLSLGVLALIAISSFSLSFTFY